MLSNLPGACIVSSECEYDVPLKFNQKLFEVLNACVDIVLRVEAVGHTERFGGCRHQLHKTPCARFGNGLRVIA